MLTSRFQELQHWLGPDSPAEVKFPGRVQIGARRLAANPETLINATPTGVSLWEDAASAEDVSLWDGLVPEPVVPAAQARPGPEHS